MNHRMVLLYNIFSLSFIVVCLTSFVLFIFKSMALVFALSIISASYEIRGKKLEALKADYYYNHFVNISDPGAVFYLKIIILFSIILVFIKYAHVKLSSNKVNIIPVDKNNILISLEADVKGRTNFKKIEYTIGN